jgi:uncharacterized protein YecE (DUF72 family)
MIWIGTSGYSYPEWRGSFYPANLPAGDMLPFYACHFSTVEINNTFYRMPSAQALTGWDAATPDLFKLTLKAPRRITHDSRLQNCADAVQSFCQVASTLGAKLGVLLFQLPPSLKKDLVLLDGFLALLGRGTRAALEFRHPSWHCPEVLDRLRQRNLAICIAVSEKSSTPVAATADYGYFRLRDEGYQLADIERWAGVVREQQTHWRDTFVYFKHEEEGKGPQFAKWMQDALADVGGRPEV